MDSLTHIVLGASIGEAVLGKKVGKKAMAFGALAGSAPDIDSVLNFFVTDLDAVVLHRGITHSLFTGALAGIVLGWLVWRFYGKQAGLMAGWMTLFTVNILLHNLLDTATVYGTALLLPFSEHRFSFDNIFVADPFYTVPLLISVSALIILSSKNTKRIAWNRFGLGLSSFYMMLTFYNHHQASSALHTSMHEKGKKDYEFIAFPTLFNSVLWSVVAQDSTGCWVGYYSIFDKRDKVDLYFVDKNDHIQIPEELVEGLNKLKVFSKGFYSVTENSGHFYFNDLRFGQVEGWADPHSNFAFSFDLTPGADNSMVVQQGRIEGTKKEVVEGMWNRMKGN